MKNQNQRKLTFLGEDCGNINEVNFTRKDKLVMTNETKKIPIKQMKKGDTFHTLYTNDGWIRMADFQIIEISGIFAKISAYGREETISTENCFAGVPLTRAELENKYSNEISKLKIKLSNKMSNTDDIGQHEMWNSWISGDLIEMAQACVKNNLNIIGYFQLSEPKPLVDKIFLDIGIVAEDNNNNRFWCHASKSWFEKII